MRLTKILVGIFIGMVAFALGYALVFPTSKQSVSTVSIIKPDAMAIPSVAPTFEKGTENNNEEEADRKNYEAKFTIKMLLTGEFHGEEVNTKSGETWLGLFKNGNKFVLRSTKIKVKQVRDKYSDEKPNQKTGKSVSVEENIQPIFLLNNAAFLKTGEIKTVFYSDFGFSEEANLINETNKRLELNGLSHNLFVKSNKSEKIEGEVLDETSKLFLSDGKTEQIIYSQTSCNDCGWGIYWAGDLDGDGKLDLFLNLTDHYNSSGLRLFLSSQAEEGKLVKEVAYFSNIGC